jgi:hypothetical protein
VVGDRAGEEGEEVKRDAIYIAIDQERMHQRDKWGGEHDWGVGDCSSDQVQPIVKAAVLAEECGEVSAAVLDQDEKLLREELVQVAAVAVAWLEAL